MGDGTVKTNLLLVTQALTVPGLRIVDEKGQTQVKAEMVSKGHAHHDVQPQILSQ
jgi:hypothetical protein